MTSEAIMHALKPLLIQGAYSVAVAESITCGQVQTVLGSLAGSSAFFAGGMTTYNFRQKTRLLSIDAEHARRVNCVSPRVATEMASGVCFLYQTDFALATTGYAEPAPELGVVNPFAYIALCQNQNDAILPIHTKRVDGAGLSRLAMQQFVTEQTLLALLDYLQC
jgi:nicotinamide-nucleotide amidase